MISKHRKQVFFSSICQLSMHTEHQPATGSTGLAITLSLPLNEFRHVKR
jgi:hypothetical protein